MRKITCLGVLVGMVWVGFTADAVQAQRQRRGGTDAAQPDGPGPQGGAPGARQAGGMARPGSPLIQAIDADSDGIISAEEIKNAVAALTKLDANQDGQLTREEYMPAGRGFLGGPGGPGGPGFGGPGGGDMVARMMENDANQDGKLSKEEVPERMQRMFDRMDRDGDGALSKEELEQMGGRFGRNRGQGGAGGPDGPGGQGNRSARPARPQ